MGISPFDWTKKSPQSGGLMNSIVDYFREVLDRACKAEDVPCGGWSSSTDSLNVWMFMV
jgi:hypothetical protein